MRRLHLFEIEDQRWCPAVLRDALTDYLRFVMDRFTPYAPAAPLLARALDRAGAASVVDLCSGGGGPWVDLLRRLRAQGRTELRVQLTDYYPNRAAFARVRDLSGGAIVGVIDPVDATDVPLHLAGFLTMFTALHHFQPAVARRILEGAVRQQRGIAIFEITRRSAIDIVGMVFFALGVLLVTPFIRPFRWSRLFWTYVIPLVPLMVWWDATVSCLRTYTPDELREMVAHLGVDDYTWDVGVVRVALPHASMTYLMGTLKSGGSD
jgi:hypothetical protein